MSDKIHQAPISLFFYWINERHQIWTRRHAPGGYPKPWTKDPILQTYKFTNVFRKLDAGTVWLMDHFIEPHYFDTPARLAFNICWYRMFNWTGTGEAIGYLDEWKPGAVKRCLEERLGKGLQVFTGAHIVRSEFGKPKIDSIIEVCTQLWNMREEIVGVAQAQNSLEATFYVLCNAKFVGGFMAYEIVSDLRHTPLLSNAQDINTWANVGPGCKRGLQRLYPDIQPKLALGAMRGLLLNSPKFLEPHVPALELREIEHSLCEFDKYCRVKFGEGRPRSLYPGKGD